MKKFNYKQIENVIGYEFNNKTLLKQAFFRSSFANENKLESNEVLEFIGDEVLDLAVMRILLEKFTKISDGYLQSGKKEGDLTKIKSELVKSENLAKAIDRSGLEKHIYYGNADLNNNAKNIRSIKEDLFEAIIGAIALDSNWDMKKVVKIIKKLLQIDEFFKKYDSDSNFVGVLQEWTSSLNLGNPVYSLTQEKRDGSLVWHAVAKVKGIKNKTEGYGFKQKEAKKVAAAKMIYEVSLYASQQKAKSKETKRDVFNIINSLVQADEITKPDYWYEETFDEDGNPEWKCTAVIDELDYEYYGFGSSKKEAQREALEALLADLNEE